MSGIDPAPEVDEVQQYPEESHSWQVECIPVTLTGNNQVSVLPARRASFYTVAVPNGQPGANTDYSRLVDSDPRIRRFFLCPSATGVTVGTHAQIAASAQSAAIEGGVLPAGWSPAFEGTGEEPLFAVGSANGLTVTVRVEYWAD